MRLPENLYAKMVLNITVKTGWQSHPLGTGRKLNVHKTFKRRPGRLLNVLCTLNFCPVSREQMIEKVHLN